MPLESELDPYTNLKDRDLERSGLFVAEGRLLVERMLLSACRPVSILCAPAVAPHFRELSAGRCPVLELPEEEIRALVGYPFHRGVLGCGVRPPTLETADIIEAGNEERRRGRRGLILLCPDLGEDANLGGVIRSAVAFGATGLLLPRGSSDPYSRRSLRYSMGASLVARIARFGDEDADVAALRAAGYALLALANRAGAPELAAVPPGPLVAVVVGNEAAGLDEAWLERADSVVRIPIADGMDSLNASVAAAIALYVMSRSPTA